MSEVLRTNKLNKHYGRIHAVNDLDLQIPHGSIFGILGPNGSGKTTTLGMVLGVVGKSSGSFEWFEGTNELEARRRIGAILEKPTFYPYLNAQDNLEIVARIKGIKDPAIDEVLNLVGLLERKDSKFKTYSLGMKQRLAIASAMLCDPDVLVLDEPTNGLDPKGIAEIREIIKKIGKSNKTILLASHLLDEVQKVCTDFAILKSGKLIHQGKVQADMGGEKVIELSASDLEQLQKSISTYPNYLSHSTNDNSLLVKVNADSSAADLNKWLFEQNIVLDRLISRTKSLEEQFLEIVDRES